MITAVVVVSVFSERGLYSKVCIYTAQFDTTSA